MAQTLQASSYPGFQANEQNLSDGHDHYAAIRAALIQDGLIDPGTPNSWRVAREPFPLSRQEVSFFQSLGNHLLAFYGALNRLYLESVKGQQPLWVHEYLDQGKPEALLSFAKMKRFRDVLPHVIRPDVIPTAQGMVITELDSVPGGIGLTGSLGRAYGECGYQIVGKADGMVQGFANMMEDVAGASPIHLAIVVSDESESYRSEMEWLGSST